LTITFFIWQLRNVTINLLVAKCKIMLLLLANLNYENVWSETVSKIFCELPISTPFIRLAIYSAKFRS